MLLPVLGQPAGGLLPLQKPLGSLPGTGLSGSSDCSGVGVTAGSEEVDVSSDDGGVMDLGIRRPSAGLVAEGAFAEPVSGDSISFCSSSW